MQANDGKSASNRGRSPDGKRIPPRSNWLVFFLLLALNYYLAGLFFPGSKGPEPISYTVFRAELAKDNVEAIHTKGESIEGQFKTAVHRAEPAADGQPAPAPREVKSFTTILPVFVDPGLETELIERGVDIRATPIQTQAHPLVTLLSAFGPALLIIGIYVWLFRRAARQGGGMFSGFGGLGKSTARRFDKETETKVTFDDVAGIDEAENELVEIVDFLKNPEKYTRLGGAAPKGVLLVGAPGTGKTLLARAVAGEAGVPFFSMSGSEFVEMIVGVGAARVRDLFKEARKNAPAIVFIDEIDSIGRARGQSVIGGASEQEQTLNQILTEMDGFSSREGVIVLAATNQPDVLDKALLRAGRFDRRVVVNLPDKAGREAIFKVHTRKVPLAEDVDLGDIAQTTPGVSGADIRNLVNEAALLAARRQQDKVHHKDFIDALEKIVLGPERPIILSEADKERIAYHEGGHAILGLVVAGADPVHRVTIVPRGQALGVTYQRPLTDRYNYPEAYLRAKIIGTLGGRAAEEIVYGTRTTGAESDIEQASGIARQMVTRWGMSDRLGMVQLAPRQNDWTGGAGGFMGQKPYSEETAKLIDMEVGRIIEECHEEAKRLLTEHRGALDALVAALMQEESLDEKEILAATGLPPAPTLPDRPITSEPGVST
ncbi:MAG: cell division protein FtsH [Comamonas sp. SCN 67-35]|uniref:ATP-dependent zinc metalloprotease FtsH n=1 Tax=unclassified Comamonas TaxID=2638500 RepID=UPI000869C6FA|nr:MULTISPECIES: ATP-dependent zinc metalloprotease FtsH [unclassified Comamonas]MBN9330167.1 ATP-dependent zinc metalloprotease FtsH [Comamonas sp.]ODU37617.1 MAG: cell division protein FtsH [Comamonas sp. SCN 67-35]OJW98589.1 MAG: cell division protein FtsH [Burkholderiales bacterium 66-26]